MACALAPAVCFVHNDMTPSIVLWVYIGLLVIGGLVGYFKGKSQVSLILSLVFAGLLSLCAVHLFKPGVDYALLGVLLLIFCFRFIKTRKFMPSGMLMSLTIVTLVLYAILSLT